MGGIEQVRELQDEEIDHLVYAGTSVFKSGAFWLHENIKSGLEKTLQVHLALTSTHLSEFKRISLADSVLG